jgi:hypothetical protein
MGATVFYSSASEIATLTNTFKVAGVATDPTTAALVVTSPNGVVNSYTWAGATLTRTGAGAFTKDVACDEAGEWVAVWTGTGTASDVTEVRWTVFATNAKLYCSVEVLKSRLGLAATDTADDLELRAAVEAASRWVDDYTGRFFWRATGTRTYTPDDLYRLVVDDVVSVTTVKTGAGDGTFTTTWAATDFQLRPVNAAARGRPYTEVIVASGSHTFPIPSSLTAQRDLVQVVGVFGWPAVPAPVREATLIMAADYFKLKDAPFGVAGFGDYGVVRVRDNPKACALLTQGHYCNAAQVGV